MVRQFLVGFSFPFVFKMKGDIIHGGRCLQQASVRVHSNGGLDVFLDNYESFKLSSDEVASCELHFAASHKDWLHPGGKLSAISHSFPKSIKRIILIAPRELQADVADYRQHIVLHNLHCISKGAEEYENFIKVSNKASATIIAPCDLQWCLVTDTSSFYIDVPQWVTK